MASGVGRLFRWLRDLVSVPELKGYDPEKPVVLRPPIFASGTDLPRQQVVEALARQRALAEQRLRRVVTDEKLLERGRRMACVEVAKELGLHEEVTARVYVLRKR